MLFFLFFFSFFIVNIYANDVTIIDTFNNLHRICIYNKEGTEIKAKLKLTDDSDEEICEELWDASGKIDGDCGNGEVEIDPDGLREKVIYYILDLSINSENTDKEYNLTLSGDNIIAGECPTDGMAKLANTTPENIANGAYLAGIATALIFFAGVIYSFTPKDKNI